jgi:hypothetical protein
MSPLGLVRRFLGGMKAMPADDFHVNYQPQVDLLFAWVGEPQQARNVEVEPGVYVRVAAESSQVIGIEILDCAARFDVPPESINRAFVKAKMDEYAAPALSRLHA